MGARKLCPVCREPYLDTWTGARGAIIYVHRTAKTADGNRWFVEVCVIDESTMIRGVSFRREPRRHGQ